MNEKNLMDIIKSALLLEYKGKALYESVHQASAAVEVKELFSMLAEEEKRHVSLLKRQYVKLLKGETIDVPELEQSHPRTAESVLSRKIIERVSGAGYEAAVISAALDFEKKAVNYYSEQAAGASVDEEKKLFQWLADWEKTHLELLGKIDNELRERIWFDNSFWPLD